MPFCNKCGSNLLETINIVSKKETLNNVKKVYVIDEGSYAAGVCLVIFLHMLGFIIALCTGKKKTRRGALYVLLFFIVLIILLGFIVVLIGGEE